MKTKPHKKHGTIKNNNTKYISKYRRKDSTEFSLGFCKKCKQEYDPFTRHYCFNGSDK